MKDRGVAPEVLQDEKDEGVVVGRCPFSPVQPARISHFRASRLDSWRRRTAQREVSSAAAIASLSVGYAASGGIIH